MNILQRISETLINPNKRELISTSKPNFEQSTKDKKKRISYSITSERIYASINGQQDLKMATLSAESINYPDRTMLYDLYHQLSTDLHLLSQLRTAYNEVLSEPLVVIDAKTEKENTELTKLIRSKWFRDLCQIVLSEEFYGFTIIEFKQLVTSPYFDKLVFEGVKIFPRQNVKPELGIIVAMPKDTTGVPFNEPPFNEWIIKVGEPENLGIMHALCKSLIFKNFSMGDWSQSSEKWGDPILIIQSDSTDDQENREKEKWGQNLGKNGFAMCDVNDKIELLERNSGGTAHKIYHDFLLFLNEEISKIINGQTGTADAKAFVGAANVQERILNGYTERRIMDLVDYLNDTLLPYLIQCNNGQTAYADLKGHKIATLRSITPKPDPNQPLEPIKPKKVAPLP